MAAVLRLAALASLRAASNRRVQKSSVAIAATVRTPRIANSTTIIDQAMGSIRPIRPPLNAGVRIAAQVGHHDIRSKP